MRKYPLPPPAMKGDVCIDFAAEKGAEELT